MDSYPEGAIVRLVATFTDTATGVVIDPTTVNIAFTVAQASPGVNPANTPTTYTYTGSPTPALGVIGRTGTGIYEVWVDSTGQAGWWATRAYSSGTGQAASPPGQVRVTAKPF